MEAKSHEVLVAEFLGEINQAIETHRKAYAWDTFWYQSIVERLPFAAFFP